MFPCGRNKHWQFWTDIHTISTEYLLIEIHHMNSTWLKVTSGGLDSHIYCLYGIGNIGNKTKIIVPLWIFKNVTTNTVTI